MTPEQWISLFASLAAMVIGLACVYGITRALDDDEAREALEAAGDELALRSTD